jgi:serine/threonine protein kinase
VAPLTDPKPVRAAADVPTSPLEIGSGPAAPPDDSSAVDLGRGPSGGGPAPRPRCRRASDELDRLRDVLRNDPATAHRLGEAAAAMPRAGATFHGFQLVRELGRGTFGRVFLARQPDVADRPVVVKVAADVGGEVRALAQLQHANIVPVYSAHAAGPLQVVCMPYLGEHTLADVIARIERRGALPASGAELVRLCRDTDAGHGLPACPALEQLQALSYVDAVLWLAVRLAEGLAFAHARGIVHCDLKPANVLLTAAGEPMLLDFNVADDTKRHAGAAVAVAGGSLPYMAPEQLAVFHGWSAVVDARCDLYSFGVLLYELLTGRLPSAESGPPPRLCPHNPDVPPALEAIVRRCLEPDPARRYPSAAALLDDLRRQQGHRPLRHAGNPSPSERLAKFSRRHPGLTTVTRVAVLAGVLLVAGAGVALAYRHRLAGAAAAEQYWLACGTARLAGEPEAALDDFAQALRVNPRSAAALQHQAYVLAERLHRPEEALQALDRAVELLPESGEVRGGRGVLLARLGRRDDAHRDARDALARDPGPARRYQAASVYALTARARPEDRAEALHLLAGALRDGYGHDRLAADGDLDALRDQPEFRRLAAAAAALRPAPRKTE